MTPLTYKLMVRWWSYTRTTLVLLPVKVHLDGMVNDEVGGADGVYLLWVAAEFHDCVAHGCKVHHGRDAAEKESSSALTSPFR